MHPRRPNPLRRVDLEDFRERLDPDLLRESREVLGNLVDKWMGEDRNPVDCLFNFSVCLAWWCSMVTVKQQGFMLLQATAWEATKRVKWFGEQDSSERKDTDEEDG